MACSRLDQPSDAQLGSRLHSKGEGFPDSLCILLLCNGCANGSPLVLPLPQDVPWAVGEDRPARSTAVISLLARLAARQR